MQVPDVVLLSAVDWMAILLCLYPDKSVHGLLQLTVVALKSSRMTLKTLVLIIEPLSKM